MTQSWTAGIITTELSKNFFKNKNLIMVPNTYWTGYECDLMVVTPAMKIIDVEIKISYRDFLADRDKNKWRKYDRMLKENVKREWPVHIWKHYFCIPKEIYVEEMKERLPSNSCGIILIEMVNDIVKFKVVKNAKANSKAKPLNAEDAISIARLASIRMWNGLRGMGLLEEENKKLKDEIKLLKG